MKIRPFTSERLSSVVTVVTVIGVGWVWASGASLPPREETSARGALDAYATAARANAPESGIPGNDASDALPDQAQDASNGASQTTATERLTIDAYEAVGENGVSADDGASLATEPIADEEQSSDRAVGVVDLDPQQAEEGAIVADTQHAAQNVAANGEADTIAPAPLTAPTPDATPVLDLPVSPQRRPSHVRADAVALCDHPRLYGRRLTAIQGELAGCSVAEPVWVESAGGVRLSPPATLNCAMARRVADWLATDRADGAQAEARAILGAGVVEITHVSAYACRTRNSREDAPLSHHATGSALDIAAFRLANGEVVTVLDHWDDGAKGRLLRALWTSACRAFGTVLGPEADAAHENHFHIDAAERRSAFCQ